MQHSKIATALLCITLVTGCTEPNGAPGRGIENGGAISKTNVAVAAGVVTGGLAGSAIGGGVGNTIAIIGGGLLGGLLGHEIGSSLDRADQTAYQNASQNAMQSGTTKTWKNSDNGHHGTIAPEKGYTDQNGRYCREYSQSIIIDDSPHQSRGTACRGSDGVWKVVE